jgi:hypothetical protein
LGDTVDCEAAADLGPAITVDAGIAVRDAGAVAFDASGAGDPKAPGLGSLEMTDSAGVGSLETVDSAGVGSSEVADSAGVVSSQIAGLTGALPSRFTGLVSLQTPGFAGLVSFESVDVVSFETVDFAGVVAFASKEAARTAPAVSRMERLRFISPPRLSVSNKESLLPAHLTVLGRDPYCARSG